MRHIGLTRTMEELEKGRLWKARDRVTGLFSRDPTNPDVLRLAGEVYFRMGDLPRSGAFWFLTDLSGEEVDAAISALGERYPNPGNLLRYCPSATASRPTQPLLASVSKRSSAPCRTVRVMSGTPRHELDERSLRVRQTAWQGSSSSRSCWCYSRCSALGSSPSSGPWAAHSSRASEMHRWSGLDVHGHGAYGGVVPSNARRKRRCRAAHGGGGETSPGVCRRSARISSCRSPRREARRFDGSYPRRWPRCRAGEACAAVSGSPRGHDLRAARSRERRPSFHARRLPLRACEPARRER